MATTQEHTVSVKLLVHKNQNKVIFAEADNHFADILFSFLTLPLGTIIRLVGGEQSDTEPAGLFEENKQIVNLLKYSLISKTPLTDAFLRAGHQTQKVICEPSAVISSNDDDDTQKFTLELLVRKSDNKVLFAEANEDFINQIFSFLTIPLGLVVRLLGGNSSYGSIDQLYASVVDQKLGKYLISPENSKLLHPKLPLHYSCDTQLLPLPVADDNRVQVNKESTSSSAYLSHYNQYTRNYSYILNPKHQNGSGYSEGGCFVKSASFVVTDDLVVKPASSILSLSFMEHLNVPTSDVEEKVIQFGIHQVYKLLNYSLVSESALTESLMDLLIKTPKRKRSEI